MSLKGSRLSSLADKLEPDVELVKLSSREKQESKIKSSKKPAPNKKVTK